MYMYMCMYQYITKLNVKVTDIAVFAHDIGCRVDGSVVTKSILSDIHITAEKRTGSALSTVYSIPQIIFIVT